MDLKREGEEEVERRRRAVVLQKEDDLKESRESDISHHVCVKVNFLLVLDVTCRLLFLFYFISFHG